MSLGAAWAVIFLARLLYAPIHFVRQRDAIIEAKDREILSLRRNEEQSFARANTSHRALEIEFEPTEPFLRRTVLPDGNARFEAYVRIRNSGNGFLSECLVNVLNIKPAPDNDRYTVIQALGSLAKGEHKYVCIAGFNESRIGSKDSPNDVITFFFATGGFFAGFASIPPPPENNPAFFTVEVKALECRAESRLFKMWVAEGRRLMLAPAEPVGSFK